MGQRLRRYVRWNRANAFAGFEAMLRSAGFEILDHPEAEVFICRRTEIDGPLNYTDELREITR